MKRITAICLAIILLLSGCAGANGGSAANDAETVETAAAEAAAETASGSTTEAAASSPAEADAEAVAETEIGTNDDTEVDTDAATDGRYSRALAKRSQSSAASDPTITLRKAGAKETQPPKTSQPEKKSCTVMIYMVGSNLESRLGNATKDLEEIDAAKLSFDDFNVLVYTGGSARWVGNVPCDHNCILDMSRKGEDRIVAQTSGNANMGMPQTLSAFLNFCDEKYPAEHNVLILWDHGGGPLWGYGADELYDNDSLLLEEMRAAMDASPFNGKSAPGKAAPAAAATPAKPTDRKLDLIGFDACLMASLESMTIWQDYADYYVGSEELEPGDGWNYAFLKALESADPESAPESADPGSALQGGHLQIEKLAESIVDTFASYYAAKKSPTNNPDLTLACVDLSKIGDVNAALDQLADKMTDTVESGEYVSLVRSRSEVKSFGMSRRSNGEVSFYYDLVDLGSLAGQMKKQYAAEAAALEEALDGAVLAEYTNIDDASGMTLYYPYKNKGQFAELNAYYGKLLKTKGYAKFLDSTSRQLLRSKSRDWNLGQPVDEGDEFTVRLTKEQMENMTEASYSILVRNGLFGGYEPFMENVKIEPDQNGVIHLKKNMKMAVIRSGDTVKLLRAEELESNRKRAVYRTKGISLRSDLMYNSHISDLESADVTINLSHNKKKGSTEILSAELEDDPSGITSGKNSVEILDWEGLSILSGSDYLLPTRDREGRLLPYEEWTRPGETVWSSMAVEGEIELDLQDIDQLDLTGQQFVQIQIEDTNGEQYASELVLISDPDLRTREVEAGSGTLEFLLYEDHAKLIGYNGREKKIVVPDAVDGLPVTAIGYSALSWLAVFDSEGFNPAREIVLPDSITELGAEAFAYCLKLEKINMPAGLKRVGSMAFANCRELREVVLPNGVESIGKCAFAYCSSLTEFRIPAGLRFMGTGGFMSCTALTKFTGGPGAAGGNAGAGEDKDVPFLAPDGAIYSADEETLLAYPCAAGDSFAVKEGTKKIEYGAFHGSSLKEVILPGSIEEIEKYAFYDCRQMRIPEFPEGIRKVGIHAFDMEDGSAKKETIPEKAEVIRIPASLESIGRNAFDGHVHRVFEVSGENRHYSAREGALMNKAGDIVLQIAADPDGTAVFPEGTVEFSEEALEVYLSFGYLNVPLKHIFLPASIKKFPEKMEDFRNTDGYVLYHCPSGSEAEQFAIRSGENYTNDMERKQGTLEKATESGTLYFDMYSDHAVLKGYSGEDEVLEIPAQADGMAVTAIGDGHETVCVYYGFMDKTGRKAPNLVKLVIPEGVTEINANALSDLKYDCEITLPSTLRRLGKRAIDSSAKIESLPAGLEILEAESMGSPDVNTFVLTPSIRYIDKAAFIHCRIDAFEQSGDNEQYSVRDGILYNADGTELLQYPNAKKEEEFEIPEGTTAVGPWAFFGNSYLRKIYFPESLEKIKEAAFEDCSTLEEVDFSKDMKLVSIGSRAFDGCRSLTEVSLPPVREVSDYAFNKCRSLHTVRFAEGTRTIGEHAFADTQVAAPVFPESLRAIGSYAFGGYSEDLTLENSAEVIRIPAKTEQIGDYAFNHIGSTRFEVDPENTSFSAVGGLLLNAAGNELLMCAAGLKGEVVVPDGVTSIMGFAFRCAPEVTDIVIPDSVMYISTVNFEKEYREDEDGNRTVEYNVTIHCSEGSYAHQFAVQRGIPCRTDK